MKKILVILLALLCLAGCGKGYSKLSDGSDVLYTGPDGDFTRNDLYKSLKLTSEDAVESDITSKIANLENIDVASIETEVDDLVSMYENMGYASYLIYSYGSIEAFKASYIADGIVTELVNLYINENYETLVAEDSPVMMQVAYFDTQEAAAQVIEDVNNGSTFDMAIANNGFETESANQVFLKSSTALDVYVKQYVEETDTTGISTVIESYSTITDENGDYVDKVTYYVCNIDSRNADDFKDEYISLKMEELDSDVALSYYYDKHDVEFYDQDIYEMMYSNFEVLK